MLDLWVAAIAFCLFSGIYAYIIDVDIGIDGELSILSVVGSMNSRLPSLLTFNQRTGVIEIYETNDTAGGDPSYELGESIAALAPGEEVVAGESLSLLPNSYAEIIITSINIYRQTEITLYGKSDGQWSGTKLSPLFTAHPLIIPSIEGGVYLIGPCSDPKGCAAFVNKTESGVSVQDLGTLSRFTGIQSPLWDRPISLLLADMSGDCMAEFITVTREPSSAAQCLVDIASHGQPPIMEDLGPAQLINGALYCPVARIFSISTEHGLKMVLDRTVSIHSLSGQLRAVDILGNGALDLVYTVAGTSPQLAVLTNRQLPVCASIFGGKNCRRKTELCTRDENYAIGVGPGAPVIHLPGETIPVSGTPGAFLVDICPASLGITCNLPLPSPDDMSAIWSHSHVPVVGWLTQSLLPDILVEVCNENNEFRVMGVLDEESLYHPGSGLRNFAFRSLGGDIDQLSSGAVVLLGNQGISFLIANMGKQQSSVFTWSHIIPQFFCSGVYPSDVSLYRTKHDESFAIGAVPGTTVRISSTALSGECVTLTGTTTGAAGGEIGFPFVLFGLGDSPQYIEEYFVGFENGSRGWEALIPNSLLSTFVRGSSSDWSISIMNPLPFSTYYVPLGICCLVVLIGVVLIALDERRRKQRLRESITLKKIFGITKPEGNY